jgi:hypothetical protein
VRKGLPLWLAGWTLCCSTTAGLKPVLDTDPEVRCPGGQVLWNIEIADQRAERRDSDRLVILLRDSLARSLPGCRWTAADRGAPTIRIEIYRFAADFDGSLWEATAEWSVRAHDPSDRTMTEFQPTATVTRPNYRSSNNEREALQQAFEQAFRRTLAGLRAVSLPR